MQEASGENVELAYVDQGYTGERPADAADGLGIKMEEVKLPEGKRGFVLAAAVGGGAFLRLSC